MALEHAGDRHRDRARLLGDDDDDGIGDLADADARAMARAEVAADIVVLRQRQDAARRRNAVIADDDRAVMERRLGEKQVAQQLRGDAGIHDGAALLVFQQRDGALEDDKHARALLGHDLAGLHGLLDDAVDLALLFLDGKDLADIFAAELFEHTPQLRLEHNDQGHKADLQDLVEDIVQQIHVEQLRHTGKDQDDEHALGDPRRTGRPDHHDDLIDEEGYDEDIHDVHDLDGREHRAELLKEIDHCIHEQNSANSKLLQLPYRTRYGPYF